MAVKEEEAVREAAEQRRFFPQPKTKRRPRGVAEEGKAAKSRATPAPLGARVQKLCHGGNPGLSRRQINAGLRCRSLHCSIGAEERRRPLPLHRGPGPAAALVAG